MRVDLGEISLEEYIQTSKMEFKDYIFTRDYVKTLLDRKRASAKWNILSQQGEPFVSVSRRSFTRLPNSSGNLTEVSRRLSKNKKIK
jgi:hypothetical protein